MKKGFKHVLFYVVLIAIVVVVCAMLLRQDGTNMIDSDVIRAFENKEVIAAMDARDGEHEKNPFRAVDPQSAVTTEEKPETPVEEEVSTVEEAQETAVVEETKDETEE